MEQSKVVMYTENRNGKVYVVFQSGYNHICGQVAVANQGSLPPETRNMMAEELLEWFFENGYQGI